MTLSSIATRLIFAAPWFFVFAQLVSGGQHRFASLAVANIVMAAIYVSLLLITLIALVVEKRSIAVPKIILTNLIVFYSLFAIFGLATQEFVFVLKDLTLMGLQIIFFILGYLLYSQAQSERILKKILRDNFFIALLMGVITSWYGLTEIVSPIFGYQALALLASMKFGRPWANRYFFAFIAVDILLWAFGKQTMVMIGLLITIWLFVRPRHHFQQEAKMARWVVAPSLVLAALLINSLTDITDSGTFKKLGLLINQFDSQSLTGAVNPAMLYLAFDDSTAGRLLEYLLIYEEAQQNPLTLLFGQGPGGALSLEVKNLYSAIESFVFSETQGVQTLPAFILLKAGLSGLVLFTYLLISVFRYRHFASHLVWPILIMIVLSCLAFATVFRFHFLFFLIGLFVCERRLKNEGF